MRRWFALNGLNPVRPFNGAFRRVDGISGFFGTCRPFCRTVVTIRILDFA
ncbi:hypothetical protein EKH55_3495 [Sinorhizobium alkalisoli]|nr:hypothetical protein EKH55_3495 [Sinorhizobium alkalisoli]